MAGSPARELARLVLAQLFLALPARGYCECHGLKRPITGAVLVAVAGAPL